MILEDSLREAECKNQRGKQKGVLSSLKYFAGSALLGYFLLSSPAPAAAQENNPALYDWKKGNISLQYDKPSFALADLEKPSLNYDVNEDGKEVNSLDFRKENTDLENTLVSGDNYGWKKGNLSLEYNQLASDVKEKDAKEKLGLKELEKEWNFHGWKKEHIVLESIWQLLNVVDWGTTTNIAARKSDGYWEINPILGRHPSREAVHVYMAASAVGHLAATHLLLKYCPKAVPFWEMLTISVTGSLVMSNLSVGLRVAF